MKKIIGTKQLNPTQIDVLQEVIGRCETVDGTVSKWSVISMLRHYPGRARGITRDDVIAYLDAMPKLEPERGI